MLGDKTNLNKFTKIKIISSMFSIHNGMKTRNQLQDENWKIHNYVEIKQLLNTQWIKGDNKNYLETNENGNITYQKLMGCSKRNSKREVNSNKHINKNKDLK